MTRRDYYFSDATEADSCIVACEASEGRWKVQLESTIFHPQGGGQPSDAGWIDDCPVLAVEAHGETLLHLVARPLDIGSARLRLDRRIRCLHARLHSAGHLIGHAGIAQGFIPHKAQHWPGASRVVFECKDGQDLDLATMVGAIAGMIEQNLARNSVMRDGLRVVSFGPLPAFPCGGTHVRSLADIGAVRLLEMKRKKNQLTISYDLCLTTHT